MMNISYRLKCIASLVTEGCIVADIGTDHGYIPIYMVTERGCPYAYGLDINEGPLKRAEQNVNKYNVSEKVTLRISDGLKGLHKNEADAIVISGMGGLLMNRILADGLETALSVRELILSPHSDVSSVRRYLADNGFRIIDEKIVCEDGKYYFILKAVPGHMNIDSDTYEYYGNILPERRDKVLYEYLIHEKNKRQGFLSAMSDDSRGHDVIEKELKIIERVMEYYAGW